MRRAAPLAAATLVLAALLWVLYEPGAIGYDVTWSLAWGEALAHLHAPDFGPELSPTPHPLANVVAALASLTGDSAPDVLLALSFLSFAALGVAAFCVGRRTFGAVAGVAFAVLLLTRPLLVEQALQGAVDVPFLALVLAALAVALRPSPSPRLVLALLLAAGLLRPEAWLLAVAYAVFARPRPSAPLAARGDAARVEGARDRPFAPLAALALAAPVLWLAWDLLLTGDPLFSFTETRALADELDRDRGLSTAIDVLPPSLEELLRPGVVWAGLVAATASLFLAQRRAELPIALLALGLGGFLVLGVFELPLLMRYLFVPAAMLVLFCAAGLAAATWLAPRGAGAVASAAVLVVLALGAPGTWDGVQERRDRAAFAHESDGDLRAVAERAPDCAPVATATHRSVPVLAYSLGVEPSEIAVVPPAPERGLLFAAPGELVVTDVAYDLSRPAADTEVPRRFERAAATRWWTVGARC